MSQKKTLGVLLRKNRYGNKWHRYEPGTNKCKYCGVKRARMNDDNDETRSVFLKPGGNYEFERPNCIRAIAFTAI